MPFDIATIGTQAAGDVLSTGMGLMLENHNDKRQLEQQQKLGQMQYNFNNQMAEENQRRALEMWEKTNYSAQREQMEKAGINPALLYGMSGGGGATTAGGNGQGVSGGNAPTGGHEIMDIGTKTNMAMMLAEIENIKANTAKTNAEIPNVAKTGANIEASTASLTQGIQNAKAQQALTELQTEYQKIANEIQSGTKEDQKQQIINLARKTEAEEANLWAHEALTDQEANLLRQNANNLIAKTVLENENLQKNLDLTDAKINEIAQSIAQRWQEIDIESGFQSTNQKRYELEKWMHDMKDSWGAAADVVGDIANILIAKGLLKQTQSPRTVIQGFKPQSKY